VDANAERLGVDGAGAGIEPARPLSRKILRKLSLSLNFFDVS